MAETVTYTGIRDITGWIHTGMWSYCPEYPGAEISELPQPAFLPHDFRVYLQKFVIGGQSGTYVETAAHVDPSAVPVCDLALGEFVLPAVVVDVGPKGPLEPLTVADVCDWEGFIRPGDALLLRTGWDRLWESPEFVPQSPYIKADAANWLMDRGIRLLASDFPRFDDPAQMQFPWDRCWKDVGLVMAPVVNLGGLSGRCGTLLAFPMKVRGACSTPCRAAILLNQT